MVTLHVHDVPDELYERLQARAEAERRSLSGEVVILLEQAMATQQDVANATEQFDHIISRADELAAKYGPFPDSVEDIRAYRNRER